MRQPLTSGSERSVSLATLPGKGLVRVCGAGCMHVTWGCVTLDFRTESAFLKMARQVQRHDRGLAEVQLAYGHASLRFTSEGFDEFAGMVAAAAEQLKQIEVVRRLLRD
ncbi:MAG: hypothetical protein ACO1SX_23470 [Actinomycetota bacterium]